MGSELETVVPEVLGLDKWTTFYEQSVRPLLKAKRVEVERLGPSELYPMRQFSTLPPGLIPQGQTRSLIEEARNRLASEISKNPHPWDSQRRGRLLATLFVSLASTNRLSPDDEEVRQKFYLTCLAKHRPLALEQASIWWAQGYDVQDGENRAFVPRPAELIRLADIAAERLEDQLDSIDEILAARPADDHPDNIVRIADPAWTVAQIEAWERSDERQRQQRRSMRGPGRGSFV